jgi:hypothetical protein
MDTKQIQLPRLDIYLSDFQQSQEFAVYILEKKLHDKKTKLSKLVHKAFNTSLIISYSRPFKGSNELSGKHKSSLERYTDKVLNEDEAKLHKKVIDKRDKAYGHSDASSHLFIGLDYNKLSIKKYPFMPLRKPETEDLKIMIEKWIAHLKKERSKLKKLPLHI